MSILVHINGAPGVGKLTVARFVAQELGARLIDNHTVINPAVYVTDRQSPYYSDMQTLLRGVVYDFMAKVPGDISFVMTDALSPECGEQHVIDEVKEIGRRRGIPVLFILLECDRQENIGRLKSAGRARHGKLTDEDLFCNLLDQYSLIAPAPGDGKTINNTHLSAEQCAFKILHHVRQKLDSDKG